MQPWRKVSDRRLIETEKFYLFDIGVTNYLSRRVPTEKTPEFGKAFEHFILMELKAYQVYRNPELMLHYWRISTGIEVAIEIKTSSRVHETDTKSLVALAASHPVKKLLLVSFES